MALEQTLEEEQSYGSPREFLEKADQLPEDEQYWLENSTGAKQTFETLDDLRSYMKDLEEDWQRFRDFIPLEPDSHRLDYRESEEAEYLSVEFPYVVLETEYGSATAGRAGSLSFGFVREKPVEQPLPATGDD